MKMVSLRFDGVSYWAQVDGGPEFLVGQRVSYQGRKGLSNLKGTPAQRYDPRRHLADHSAVWLYFLAPTAAAEGGLFHTLNTYDRAAFTFGFLQYAAHVPDGDFVVYLRALLALPGAADYFPDLVLLDGRVHRHADDGLRPLESAASTAPLMAWLNPSTAQVEDTEVIQAARFIHWVQNDPAHRALQVRSGVEHMQAAMRRYDAAYGLDGRPIEQCLLVADIRHQGRGSSSEIRLALQANQPVEALLNVGANQYPERIKTLRKALKMLAGEPSFAGQRWRSALKDFSA
ncbi:hypothetical protein KAK07_13510 [Ideonella sp. 4Y16]|uniref:Uncharacterized protein n=1 Tax=Ideonella alba TaxID=2824118 RepID=A0A940Y9P4_9BURK|nr:hypothetical protein [Ideonella alba]MBQ0931206.1 hypothetical protein [Ideonella alba]MBQ0944351.1 hypothetical protein [Ideonella alba]